MKKCMGCGRKFTHMADFVASCLCVLDECEHSDKDSDTLQGCPWCGLGTEIIEVSDE